MIIHLFLQKVNTGVGKDSWNERNVPYLDCSDGFMMYTSELTKLYTFNVYAHCMRMVLQ